ncbi:MAG TPA: hypothetical protein VGN56_02825 [Candidatus Paceibacterota bacterium]|jgi:hypothetical protein|nr:hypothetical protein [Candidatus Paceibacterota bacterium]
MLLSFLADERGGSEGIYPAIAFAIFVMVLISGAMDYAAKSGLPLPPAH